MQSIKGSELAESRRLIDGSRLVIESLARSGADVFVGYPITPANLLYSYAMRRFPAALSAPDEITAAQWLSGFSATGLLPVTATSFPGFALMLETINMAYMMELPLLVILAQRLGPATGSATAGADGDLLLLRGTISGGHILPVIAINSVEDCWNIPPVALAMTAWLRTPVILLTSKEITMSQFTVDIAQLPPIEPVLRRQFSDNRPFLPYEPEKDLVPPFLPVGNSKYQVRLNASTHDTKGIIQHLHPEALKNTARLEEKLYHNLQNYTRYYLDEQPGADTLLVTWGVTALATREAALKLREKKVAISVFIPNTLLPVPEEYLKILARYPRIIVAEENSSGQLRQILFGVAGRPNVTGVNSLGKMISPEEIVEAVLKR